MRSILLAGAFALSAIPAITSAQTTGTPPADPTGSNTASANLPPATGPNSTMESPAPRTPDTSTPSAMPDTGSTVGGATNASPPAGSMPKTYPVCSRTVRDECRSRGGK